MRGAEKSLRDVRRNWRPKKDLDGREDGNGEEGEEEGEERCLE